MVGHVLAIVRPPMSGSTLVNPTKAPGGSLSQRERIEVRENATNSPSSGDSIVPYALMVASLTFRCYFLPSRGLLCFRLKYR